METKVLTKEKNEIIFEISSLTLAEILRTYLNKDSSVEFAAWKREHFTKNPVMKVKTSGKDTIKTIDDAIKAISLDLNKLETNFKQAK
jgi:DNA-directed RNA polymerase subunit L